MNKKKALLYASIILTFSLLAIGSLLLILGVLITNNVLLYLGLILMIISVPFELGLVIYVAKRFIVKNR